MTAIRLGILGAAGIAPQAVITPARWAATELHSVLKTYAALCIGQDHKAVT